MRATYGYETAKSGAWEKWGITWPLLPTIRYSNGLLVVGLIVLSRWYWFGISRE